MSERAEPGSQVSRIRCISSTDHGVGPQSEARARQPPDSWRVGFKFSSTAPLALADTDAYPSPGGGRYLNLEVEDTDEDQRHLLPQLARAAAFLRETDAAAAGGRGGGCLVHCAAGVSRSSSVVAACLMSLHRFTLREALRAIRERRPIAWPNEALVLELGDFEVRVFPSPRAALLPSPRAALLPSLRASQQSCRGRRPRSRFGFAPSESSFFFPSSAGGQPSRGHAVPRGRLGRCFTGTQRGPDTHAEHARRRKRGGAGHGFRRRRVSA